MDPDEVLNVGEGREAAGASESAECSGNPQSMWDYSEVGLERLAALRMIIEQFSGNVLAYRNSVYMTSIAEHAVDLDDRQLGRSDSDDAIENHLDNLVADWQHLDRFVGQVGTALYKADNGEDPDSDIDPDQVIQAGLGDLLEHGEIGLADRGDAIEDARQLAGELGDLEGASVGEFEAWLGQVERGKNDPAFAVAFAEELGVSGFENAPGIVESVYGDDFAQGYIHAIDVLGVTLHTAEDTVEPGDDGDYKNPANAGLADDERLSDEFVVDAADSRRGDDGLAVYDSAGEGLATASEESARVVEEVNGTSDDGGRPDGSDMSAPSGNDPARPETANSDANASTRSTGQRGSAPAEFTTARASSPAARGSLTGAESAVRAGPPDGPRLPGFGAESDATAVRSSPGRVGLELPEISGDSSAGSSGAAETSSNADCNPDDGRPNADLSPEQPHDQANENERHRSADPEASRDSVLAGAGGDSTPEVTTESDGDAVRAGSSQSVGERLPGGTESRTAAARSGPAGVGVELPGISADPSGGDWSAAATSGHTGCEADDDRSDVASTPEQPREQRSGADGTRSAGSEASEGPVRSANGGESVGGDIGEPVSDDRSRVLEIRRSFSESVANEQPADVAERVNLIRESVGERISGAVESASERIGEQVSGPALDTAGAEWASAGVEQHSDASPSLARSVSDIAESAVERLSEMTNDGESLSGGANGGTPDSDGIGTS